MKLKSSWNAYRSSSDVELLFISYTIKFVKRLFGDNVLLHLFLELKLLRCVSTFNKLSVGSDKNEKFLDKPPL